MIALFCLCAFEARGDQRVHDHLDEHRAQRPVRPVQHQQTCPLLRRTTGSKNQLPPPPDFTCRPLPSVGEWNWSESCCTSVGRPVPGESAAPAYGAFPATPWSRRSRRGAACPVVLGRQDAGPRTAAELRLRRSFLKSVQRPPVRSRAAAPATNDHHGGRAAARASLVAGEMFRHARFSGSGRVLKAWPVPC